MRRLSLFFSIFLFFWTSLNASFVSCHLMGQLGNQLFEIATTLAYAWDHDLAPVFPELHSNAHRISYNRDALFFRLDDSVPPRPFAQRVCQRTPFSIDSIPALSDLYLDGYWQSWKYFHHYREELLSIFAPSDFYMDYLENKYAELLRHPKTVAIHVRTSVKWKHDAHKHPFVGFDYYERAIALFPEDSLFVIFSDRIESCKKRFSKMGKNILFIEGNDHIADFHLMSKMQHVILGTSTFSWWGAYLNENPNKIVVAPQEWLHPDYWPSSDYVADFYLPEWILLPVFFGDYPEEFMEGEPSQSLDDN